MYCTTCGKELPEGATICDGCNTRVDNPDAEKADQPKNPETPSENHRPYMDYQPFSGQNSHTEATGDNNSHERASSSRSGTGQPYSGQPYSGQPYFGQPGNPYTPETRRNQAEPEGHTGLAIAGLVIGIISICSCCIPMLNIPLGILGLIFSILGMKSSYRGIAIAGLVLSIIALVFGILIILAIIVSDGNGFYYYWDLY